MYYHNRMSANVFVFELCFQFKILIDVVKVLEKLKALIIMFSMVGVQ